nr:vinorine synthase-like [Tanacetum cinerariifolium]GFA49535.1 vinorine synthase-like [Tanacetum cinerariifolium]
EPLRNPTKTEATTSLVWKAAAKATSTVRTFSLDSPHVLGTMMNLRKRAYPPLPKDSIKNIIDDAVGICFY